MSIKDLPSFDNVFYDSFDEVKQYEFVTEVWEESKVICLADTSAEVGFFPKSDIIIFYNKETLKPVVITERIFKKDYTRREWKRKCKHLLNKVEICQSELGFDISVTISKDFLDFSHCKGTYWKEWVSLQRL